MCDWISQKLERTPSWINHIWFSDEAHFHLNSAVNNHNNIFWGSDLPEEITERQLKGPKVTAFVAFNARHGLLGPYWFEEDGKTVTINAARYRDVIAKFYDDLSATLSEGQLRMAWFKQNGAPPHTAQETIAYLRGLFNTRSLPSVQITSGPRIALISTRWTFGCGERQSNPYLLKNQDV